MRLLLICVTLVTRLTLIFQKTLHTRCTYPSQNANPTSSEHPITQDDNRFPTSCPISTNYPNHIHSLTLIFTAFPNQTRSQTTTSQQEINTIPAQIIRHATTAATP
ncbi:hypothetical protein PGT21_013214 [Puccinia graminis f. sp. tritici]|uniref:Secreted protein n=1 Tax=Puccinia graminis f. sp. tritici TaxID=56615 RepID=A0A5B0MES3_PUCGR|nr:hypothetical protein PGT21_013214 [Puccinia graminis f. sp. tritici]